MAAEYSTTIAPQPTTSYLTTDHLGSPRVITDRQGNVTSRRDFLPFGEEISAGIGARTFEQKYSAVDSIRQRFTGYEKDNETDINNNGAGLDFAEARMYQSKHGRFTAADPLLSSANLGNPQTFNRYVYVGNNPVNITDPLGLDWCAKKNDPNQDVSFAGQGVKCGADENTYETATVSADGNLRNGDAVKKGDRLRLHANGDVTVIRGSATDNSSVGTGVQSSSNPGDLVTGDVGVPASEIAQRPLEALPPCPVEVCGSSTPFVEPRLDTASAEKPNVVKAIEAVYDACSWIPGIGTPCSIMSAVIKAGSGDGYGAVDSLSNAIPGFGTLNKARKADKVVDAVQAAQCLLCFVAGTEIQTIDGLKPIEEIKVGDQVLSYNERAGRNEFQVVYFTFQRFADDICAITIENEKRPLEVTSEHPFYIKVHQARDSLGSGDDDEGEWEEVRDLEAGDEIRLASGNWAKILDIRFKGTGRVFNFSVSNNNNYYVGNSRLLTHNAGCGRTSSTGAADLIKRWLGEGAEKITKSDADLMLKSKDGTKSIRFDLINSHGDKPHINVETWKPRKKYPGDKTMKRVGKNVHIYPPE